ncbi:unnamed protein product, partial [Mesorhabditis belari]|uniref:Uncharacterized protein n=1 Tax=Mesorhabditis belari TaxID=2138241 RepID=A0AAF3EP14_9BILA
MNATLRFLIICLLFFISIVLTSPVHGIWRHFLRHEPDKRSYYGVFQHIPGYLEDGRDKKNYFWFLNNDPLGDEDPSEYS